MITINLSEKTDYYTQRNNKFYPNGACNVTSMIVGLFTSRIQFNYPPGMQPEDYLMRYLMSDEAYQVMDKLAPWARRGGYSPQHVHVMLEWAVNKKLVGSDVVKFRTDISMKQIVESILKGSSVVVSGKFTKFGHIVTVVGIKTDQENIRYDEEIDMSQIRTFIIDDPYGNYHTGYSDVRGNDIEFDPIELNSLLKKINNTERKYAHIFNGVV